MDRPGLCLSMAAMNALSRGCPLIRHGFPRGAAFTSSMAPRDTIPSITSTLSLSMSTRLRTCPAYSPSGEPTSRLTAILFSSLESSTPRGTSSWWRGSGRSHGREQDELEGLNLSGMLERLEARLHPTRFSSLLASKNASARTAGVRSGRITGNQEVTVVNRRRLHFLSSPKRMPGHL
jgi:hypothetical protein